LIHAVPVLRRLKYHINHASQCHLLLLVHHHLRMRKCLHFLMDHRHQENPTSLVVVTDYVMIATHTASSLSEQILLASLQGEEASTMALDRDELIIIHLHKETPEDLCDLNRAVI
jgi:hypothetical protein